MFVKSEPLTYGLENPHNSFFLDMVRARRNNDVEARARLERHRSRRWPSRRAVNPNTTAGTGRRDDGTSVGHRSLVGDRRGPGACVGDLALNLPLPSGISSVHAPKITSRRRHLLIQPAQGSAVASAGRGHHRRFVACDDDRGRDGRQPTAL